MCSCPRCLPLLVRRRAAGFDEHCPARLLPALLLCASETRLRLVNG